MTKVYEALQWASSFLEKHGREEKIGEFLLMHELGVSKSGLLMNYREALDAEIEKRFVDKVNQHVTTGVPFQHLVGTEMFYGRVFKVNESVLIPRPETEELISLVMKEANKYFPENKHLQVADIGTGSGIIAITVALELAPEKVYAVDISNEALTVARENAANLSANSVYFYQGDLLAPLVEKKIKVDILISNPPYIPLTDRATLSDVVVNYDPELALFGGIDGLDCYKKMIPQLKSVLKSRALVGFEIGHGQGEAVVNLLQKAFPTAEVLLVNDINGKERIVFCKIYSEI